MPSLSPETNFSSCDMKVAARQLSSAWCPFRSCEGLLQCRILVSSTRKPVSHINLAKRFLSEHGEVHLSALGVAIGPMVTVAEILKSRHLATVTKLRTSLEMSQWIRGSLTPCLELQDTLQALLCMAWKVFLLPCCKRLLCNLEACDKYLHATH